MATQLSIYGSDEIPFQDCDVCKFQNVTSDAVSYCTICSKYMCTACNKVHMGSKLSRNHKLLTVSNLTSASTTTKPTSSIMFCEHHKTMIVDMYCKSHDEIICSACKITSHKMCKLTDLNQETKQMQTDGSFNETKIQLEDLQSHYDNMKAMRKTDERRFKCQLEKCRRDLRQIRKDINATLDSIEHTLSKEIQHADESITKDMAGHIAKVDEMLFQIMEQLKNLKDSERVRDDQVMFVEMKRASIARKTFAETLAEMEEDINKHERQFKINDSIFDTVRQLQSVETVLHDGHDIGAGIAYRRMSQKSLLNKSISGRRDISIDDTSVVGCTFMPDGHLVLCCGHSGLKLLDRDFNIKSQLNERAQRVAAINDNETIVTQGINGQIQKVQLFPQMKVIKTMKIGRPCMGVDIFGEEIYVTCRDRSGGNGEVRVLTMDGKVKHILGLYNGKYLFKQPEYVTINTDGSKVFISDFGTHTVTCLSTQGHVIYQYSDPELNYPQGMYLDCDGFLLVCGLRSNNVHVIGQDGRKEKIMFLEADGEMNPYCISVRPSDGCLVIGIYNGNDNKSLLSYKAE